MRWGSQLPCNWIGKCISWTWMHTLLHLNTRETRVENYSWFWLTASNMAATCARVPIRLPFLVSGRLSRGPTASQRTNHITTVWKKNEFLPENLQTTSGKTQIMRASKLREWSGWHAEMTRRSGTAGLLLARGWLLGDHRSRDGRDLSGKWSRRLCLKQVIGLITSCLLSVLLLLCMSEW